jgi:hypothetical protein
MLSPTRAALEEWMIYGVFLALAAITVHWSFYDPDYDGGDA